MEKDLTFYELTHLVGATVISCDFDGNAVEEYVIEKYDSEHGRISVSKRIDNHVTSIWPEELYMWHFRLLRGFLSRKMIKISGTFLIFQSAPQNGDTTRSRISETIEEVPG